MIWKIHRVDPNVGASKIIYHATWALRNWGIEGDKRIESSKRSSAQYGISALKVIAALDEFRVLQECLWAKSSRAQYGIWALKVIAALGQGEEIQGQAAPNQFQFMAPSIHVNNFTLANITPSNVSMKIPWVFLLKQRVPTSTLCRSKKCKGAP